MNDTAILLDQATKKFDGRAVVEALSFQIDRGQILGLIGPSGCGKTTTVRMVMGVYAPDHGRVVVLGREPHRFGARLRERIGYMPQHFVLYPELSVRENLDFVASLYGVKFFGRDRLIREMLDFVELADARHTLAGQISGGMQRRLELACALIHQPDLVVFDEPTAGIDPVLRQKFWDHFRHLRDQGRTLLVTTQYVVEAEYCDAVAAMQDGRLVAVGPPEEVRRTAIGGEIVHLAAEGLTRSRMAELAQIEGVHRVDRLSPDELSLTVDDASAVMPRLMSALQASGITIGNISEHRPNFDEVFVRLMAQREPPAPTPDASPPDERIAA